MARTALLGGVAVVVLITLGSILPLASGLLILAVFVWFAFPGIVLALRLYGTGTSGMTAAALVGPAWGYVLSSLVLLALWAAGVRGYGWLMLAPIPAMVAVLPAGRVAPYLSVPGFTRKDAIAVAFVLLAVLAIDGRPYSRVGIDL